MQIRIYHWWPGREWREASPIPSWMVKRAEEKGTRYLTLALLYDNMDLMAHGTAECCPKDMPSRKLGREIAVGRMWQDAIRAGYVQA